MNSPRCLVLCAFLLFTFAPIVALATPKIEIKDRTLVAWVTTENTDLRSGSALTIGEGQNFDGLVFAEKVPLKWSAGSEFFRRNPTDDAISGESEVVANQLVQVALVQQGTSSTLYRDGKLVASWTNKEPSPAYDASHAYVMFGWRHNGAIEPSFFQGTIDDARIYDKALTAEQIAVLKPKEQGAEKPLGWWDFAEDAKDKMGTFHEFKMFGNAKVEGGKLHLHGAGDYVSYTHPQPTITRIQYRPDRGNFADPIPFYWKGQYHIFYLQGGIGKVPWQHIVSDNLVDWKPLPTVLKSDGAPDSWDGGNMFTGTVIEDKGKFYCFYTGDNGANPLGNEGVRLATSDDLITWMKQPDFLVVPDGKIYAEKKKGKDNPNDKFIRDFRDPFPYKIPGKDEWWMILCANDEKNSAGVYTSTNLKDWTAADPLQADLQECPDLFKIGETYYLIGGDHYSTSSDLRGKFVKPVHAIIDRPGVYAGKRMFDGKRHIWVGWICDTQSLTDSPHLTWGGTMCTPRELIPGPDGILYVRPVQEAIDAFSEKVAVGKPEFEAAQWTDKDGALTSTAVPARALWTIPTYGMLTMKLKVSADSNFTVAFHCDPAEKQDGYFYTIMPSKSQVLTKGGGPNWSRGEVKIPTDKPVELRAIMIGDAIEFFINDQYAFTRRAYDLKEGKLGLNVDAGTVTVEDIKFSQMRPAKS